MSSKKFSFEDWGLLEFIKGRKKMIVTVLGALVGYLIKDTAIAAILAGAIADGGFALIEYYCKSY